MTPTEQDNELFENSFGEWLENHGIELSGNNPSHLGTWQAMVDMNELKLAIKKLITADRKRVALEARINTAEHIQNTMVSPAGGYCDEILPNAIPNYIAQLKAQQEKCEDS